MATESSTVCARVCDSLESLQKSLPSCSNLHSPLDKILTFYCEETPIETSATVDLRQVFNEKVHAFMENLFVTVEQKTKSQQESREILWATFHQLRISSIESVVQPWKEIMRHLKLDYSPVLFQSLLNEIFKAFLRDYFTSKASSNSQTSLSKSELKIDELNTLRYVCGYVVRTLLKKYEGMDDEVYSQFEQCLGQMAVTIDDSDDFIDTTKWFHQVNRGGFLLPNEITFMLFIELERMVLTLLPYHTTKQSNEKLFQESVIKKIVDDDDIQFYWALMSQDIDSPSEAEKLLKDIVQLWVTIRGFALATSWMEEFKKTTQKTTQKAASLRKTLAK